eukprot:6105704-Prorocentrum_lima.AAC.1
MSAEAPLFMPRVMKETVINQVEGAAHAPKPTTRALIDPNEKPSERFKTALIGVSARMHQS